MAQNHYIAKFNVEDLPSGHPSSWEGAWLSIHPKGPRRITNDWGQPGPRARPDRNVPQIAINDALWICTDASGPGIFVRARVQAVEARDGTLQVRLGRVDTIERPATLNGFQRGKSGSEVMEQLLSYRRPDIHFMTELQLKDFQAVISEKHGARALPTRTASDEKTPWRDASDRIPQGTREKPASPETIQVVGDFMEDVRRMATTALNTLHYANGQMVIARVKPKDTDMSPKELQDEVERLFVEQDHHCALTGYNFNKPSQNKHLMPSLDRKDSALGYVSGNLQIVTRAANFFKSASDARDWMQKSMAMEEMAIAMKKRRKASNT